MRRVIAAALLLASVSSAGQPVRARHTMVVTRETHATEIGDRVLAAGGNAVDAAVAVAFMLAVTHPSAGNLGGGGFMLIRLANGKSTFLDFRERAPAAASRDMYLDANGEVTKDSLVGYRASGVPGTVKGLEYAHKKYGKMPWNILLTPAVDLAGPGFPISWGLAQSLRSKATSEKLSKFKDSKRIFLNDGQPFEAGDTLVQADLAWTLSRIRAQGAEDFYNGETAKRLVADMQGPRRPRHYARRSARLQSFRTRAADRRLSRIRCDQRASPQFRRRGNPADDGDARRNRLCEDRRRFGALTAFSR